MPEIIELCSWIDAIDFVSTASDDRAFGLPPDVETIGMSASDPMMFAASASRLTNDEVSSALLQIDTQSREGDYEQAIMDEARLRGLVAPAAFFSRQTVGKSSRL